MTIAVLHEYVPNTGDAKKMTHDELARYFERVQAFEAASSSPADPHSIPTAPPPEQVGLLELANAEPSPLAQETIGGYLHLAELLGRRVAELHVALASAAGGLAFAPEPFSRLYQRGLYQSMRNQSRTTLDMLRLQRSQLSESAQARADLLLQQKNVLVAKFGELTNDVFHAERIRCHGDLHLGQVLFTGKDFVIIDFEGDSSLPVSERRIKASPLRDVAGMLRSFHYAAHAATLGEKGAHIIPHAVPAIADWARFWSTWVSASFLRSYLATARPGNFLPPAGPQLETLLTAYLLERALKELRYDLQHRPERANVPLTGIRHDVPRIFCLLRNLDMRLWFIRLEPHLLGEDLNEQPGGSNCVFPVCGADHAIDRPSCGGR
jgi:maltose alpha-D-glucosyltransferase/alpha-amylase